MHYYAIWVVTSILCGLAAASIARQKGRDPVQWFFVGVAANVLALVVMVAVAARKKRKAAEEFYATVDMRGGVSERSD